MRDDRLRELERRAKETRSVEDEAAYLAARVRAGELTQENLELAAYCGHEAACRITGRRPWSTPRTTDEWLGWVGGLRRWSSALGLRAYAAAFKEVALPTLLREPDLRASRFATTLSQMRDRLDAWLKCPTDSNLQAFVEIDPKCRFVANDPAGLLMTLPGGWEPLASAVRRALVEHVLSGGA